MKTRSFFARCALLLGLSLIIAFACQKLEFDEPDATATAHETTGNPNVFNVGGEGAISPRSDEPTPTILGNPRVNPFTTTVMTEAWNNLTGQNLPALLPATHYYVKFLPATLDQFKKLNETELALFDYPLEYEIIQMGDYYDDPAVPEGGIPPLYTVVEADAPFPTNIPHEIKAELLLAPSDSYLVKEAFRLTGNSFEVSYVGSGGSGTGRPEPDPECQPGCPNYPCCLEPDIFCDDVPCVTDPSQGCHPGSPNWPECLGGGGGSSEFTQNDCGCTVFTDMRKPGGCIKVEDSELSTPNTPSTFEGVRRVRVTMRDNWFSTSVTFTDDNGCWKINRRFSGRAWMSVKFESERARFRGAAQNFANVWEWATTIKDNAGAIAGPVFNNIAINYHIWTAQGSQAQRFWGAATVNNALHEFHDFAVTDGIASPPLNLSIWLSRTRTNGFALMKNFLGASAATDAILSGLLGSAFLASLLDVITGGFVQATWLNIIAPDVMIGTGFQQSDVLKQLAYHELAHTSHFVQVGPLYWFDVIEAEVGANGWGNENSNDAGRIAVCESWAEHIGMTYAHRRYPVFNSIFLGTWETRLEETRNDSPNHVPIGLHHDLVDSGLEPESEDVSGDAPPSTVNDQVSGFTINQMFSALTSDITTPDQYRIRLLNLHLGSTSNTTQQVNDLFGSY
ncbi:MAG: hypothetical protein ACKV1O_18030 [Saprospiraceae bacterium]